MGKKPFNKIGCIWIVVSVGGLLLLFSGLVWSVVNPEGQFVNFLEGPHGDGSESATMFAILGVGWLIIFGILAPAFYKKSVRELNARWAAETATIHTVLAKVISKASQVTGDYFSTGTIYHVAFDFPDGSRNSFSVDAAQYSMLVENETGLLTYKQQGDYLFFVDFRRQA